MKTSHTFSTPYISSNITPLTTQRKQNTQMDTYDGSDLKRLEEQRISETTLGPYHHPTHSSVKDNFMEVNEP